MVDSNKSANSIRKTLVVIECASEYVNNDHMKIYIFIYNLYLERVTPIITKKYSP